MEGSVGPTQHTLNPPPRAAFERNLATQWPLPNIPASYPIVPMDPVTVQSDQHSSWPLLRHFDALMKSLIREVYSPQYRIPAESRSRFTGAIRETHTLEVVKSHSRHKSKVSQSSLWVTHEMELPQGYYERQTPTTTHMLQRKEGEDSGEALAADRLSSADQVEGFSPAYPVASLGSEVGAGDQSSKPTGRSWLSVKTIRPSLASVRSVQEADRNDVVDDLVRLWTLVR